MSSRIAVLLACLALCGCAGIDPDMHVSIPLPPQQSGPAPQIEDALACIAQSGALRGTRIAVAIHSDGTGKSNHFADGATGNFLPQGTTAVWASEALLLAGAHAYDYYELNTETAMRNFGGDDLKKLLQDKEGRTLPDYVLSTMFTALDFIGGPQVDVAVKGWGGSFTGAGAALEASAELYRPGSRTILKISSMRRYVAFTEVGFSVARFFGSTLTTASAFYADQQRLQEAARDVVELSVADILAKFPSVPATCRARIKELKSGHSLASLGAEENYAVRSRSSNGGLSLS